jgi:hypothetical protein
MMSRNGARGRVGQRAVALWVVTPLGSGEGPTLGTAHPQQLPGRGRLCVKAGEAEASRHSEEVDCLSADHGSQDSRMGREAMPRDHARLRPADAPSRIRVRLSRVITWAALAQADQSIRRWGSSTSLSQSPTTLMPKTVAVIARPGKTAGHQALL